MTLVELIIIMNLALALVSREARSLIARGRLKALSNVNQVAIKKKKQTIKTNRKQKNNGKLTHSIRTFHNSFFFLSFFLLNFQVYFSVLQTQWWVQCKICPVMFCTKNNQGYIRCIKKSALFSQFNPLVPRVQKIKIRNSALKRLLIVEFVKKMVYLDAHYSEHQGLMG